MNEDYLGCYSEESDPVYALMEISKMLKKLWPKPSKTAFVSFRNTHSTLHFQSLDVLEGRAKAIWGRKKKKKRNGEKPKN
jgi:hypothetical protein